MLAELFLPSISIIIECVCTERGEKALIHPVALIRTDLLLHQSCVCPPKSLAWQLQENISEQHRLREVAPVSKHGAL